jgi:tetratricopeptide (TPR) repeat protein
MPATRWHLCKPWSTRDLSCLMTRFCLPISVLKPIRSIVCLRRSMHCRQRLCYDLGNRPPPTRWPEPNSDHPVKAEALFRAYLAQRPGDASAHYGLGHLLQMQQRSDEAAQEFHRSIEIKPVQTESYYQLGQMDLDAHRDVVARPLFEKTLSRMPTHGGALVGLGILDFRAKNYLSARRELDAAVASTPDYEPAHYYLGLTLARLGDKAASERELAVASSLNIKQQGKAAPVGVIDGPP